MTAAAPAIATTYQIDKAHSEATFQVRHLLSKVRGRFSDLAGTVQLDETDPSNSAVSFVIQAASVDTNQSDRDAHLRSEDFFAVDRFPTITFASRNITARGNGRFDVAGDLSIRGVTRQVVLPVTFLGQAKDPWGVQRVAFEAETTINRKDYGLNWNALLETGGLLVGDDVHVSVSLQAVAA